jgi:hypothetical protein
VAVEITNTMHRFASVLYSICWLLHVSAVFCLVLLVCHLGHMLYIHTSLLYFNSLYILFLLCHFNSLYTLFLCHVNSLYILFYAILTHCTSCCCHFNSLYIMLFICHFNSLYILLLRYSICFYSTQAVLLATSYLLYILDKPPYRSVFSRNSDGSRISLKMADYCQNM